MTARKRPSHEPLMTTAEAAAYLRFPVGTVRMWRTRGTGPTYIKVNNAQVRYRVEDLDAWIDEQAVSA